MGHKVHPYGFRLGVTRTWTAKWYQDKEYTSLLKEDITIRELVGKRLANASVSGIEIERNFGQVTVTVHTAKPGIVIGSIFVIVLVMGDFVTIGVMGGFVIYFPEIFPTRLRSTGTAFGYNVARLSAAVVTTTSCWGTVWTKLLAQ